MEERLQAIEDALNDLQTNMNSVATKAEVILSVNTRQSDIDDLVIKLDSLRTQVSLLQALELLRKVT